MTGTDLSAAAQHWVEHLREGGSTPWVDWLRADTVYAPPASSAQAVPLPGAAQLDLLRRLNEVRPARHLADRVISRAPVGRGAAEIPLPLDVGLVLDSCPDPRVAAVLRRQPDIVPAREILRVATGVLVDLLIEAVPEQPRPGPRSVATATGHAATAFLSGWAGLGRRLRGPGPNPSFALAGAPGSVAALRARLTAVGLSPADPRKGGQNPDRVIIVTEPLVVGLADVWSSRVQAGSARPWRGFVARASHDALPTAVAYARTAQRWAAEVGPEHVHVVTQDGLLDQVEKILGRRPSPVIPPRAAGEPERLRPLQVDILRRVNAVLTFRSKEHDAAARRALLVAAMSAYQEGPPSVDLPPHRRTWAAEAARGMADELRASGIQVHGDLGSLSEWKSRRWARLRRREVVDGMVRTIHRVDEGVR